MTKTTDEKTTIEKAGDFVKKHPYATAAVVAGGAAAAGGAFYAAQKSKDGINPEQVEESLDDETEDEIAAGAIAY